MGSYRRLKKGSQRGLSPFQLNKFHVRTKNKVLPTHINTLTSNGAANRRARETAEADGTLPRLSTGDIYTSTHSLGSQQLVGLILKDYVSRQVSCEAERKNTWRYSLLNYVDPSARCNTCCWLLSTNISGCLLSHVVGVLYIAVSWWFYLHLVSLLFLCKVTTSFDVGFLNYIKLLKTKSQTPPHAHAPTYTLAFSLSLDHWI